MASSADGAVEKPCVITQGLPSYTETVGPPASTKTNTKRWLIMAISAVVVIAMVTGATLFGVYMQNNHVRSLVQEMTVKTRNGKERIRADPEKAEEEYDLPDKKLRVLHDFNKGISVFRTTLEKKFGCFLLPLNQTEMMTPKALASYLKKGDLDEEDGGNYPFDLVASETKVKDISFLSDNARSMCDGLPVYWLMPGGQDVPEIEDKTDDKTGHRQKRLVGRCRRRRVCQKVCYCVYVFIRGRLCCVTRCYKICSVRNYCGCCG